MNTPLGKDARGFVDGVVSYLKNEGKSKTTMPKVEAFLGRVTAQSKRQKTAKVVSSVALTAPEQKELVRVLSTVLGHEVALENSVNPGLVAGLWIQVGDWIVDTTLKSQLEQMATVLKQ
jgi:F-type H+-transporting ATPase subunit delta